MSEGRSNSGFEPVCTLTVPGVVVVTLFCICLLLLHVLTFKEVPLPPEAPREREAQ